MDKQFTFPQCEACSAHDDLNRKVDSMEERNTKEHSEILTGLEKAIVNIDWMKRVGTWILMTMLGYYVIIGYYVLTVKYVTPKDVAQIHEDIQKGEDLHNMNEKTIENIEGKLDILILLNDG